MAKKELTIYFDEKGNLLSYPMYGYVEKPNYEFETTLKYVGFTRGQSAARMIFKDLSNNARYDMFLTDFNDVVNDMVNGKIKGTFTFCKRGQNYGVKKVC